jgi:hypothetical protein
MARKKNSAPQFSGPSPKKIKLDRGLESASLFDVLVLCLSQGNQPNCALALVAIAVQLYCVNHGTVVNVHNQHIRPAIGGVEAVWHNEEGFDIQHVMSALFTIFGGYNDPDELFPGAHMLVPVPVAQGPAPVGEEEIVALRAFVESGWTEPSSTIHHHFDMWVVSVPVVSNEVDLVHMYAIKAFYKVGETTKTWVVLDVVPGFLPYIVEDVPAFLQDRIRRVAHLQHSFDEINAEAAFVFGVKGEYATRSFDRDERDFIGLPYNVTPVPDGVPFSYSVYNLASLRVYQPPVPAAPVDLNAL